MGVRQPGKIQVIPTGPEDEPRNEVTPPEPPPEPEPEPPPAEPEPEPPPAEPEPEPAPAESEPEPEPPPAEPKDEYSDEEWAALSPEQQAAVWEEVDAAQAESVGAREKAVTESEKKLEESFVKLEKSQAESERMFRDRMTEVGKLAKDKGVREEYQTFKDGERVLKKPTAQLFEDVEIEDLIPNPKDARERQANVAFKATGKKIAQALGKVIAPQLEVLNTLRTGLEEGKRVVESQEAWRQTALTVAQEFDIADEDAGAVVYGLEDRLNNEKMTPLGSAMSEEARAATVRRIFRDLTEGTDGTAKPAPGKVLKFPTKPPAGVRAGRKPPRRAPRTMGSRGGTVGKPEPSKRSVRGDMAAGVDVK